MSSLDNREQAFENKFAHDEEVKFKITSRRRKLLGLWAAEAFGLNEEDSLKYALSIVQYGIDDNNSGAVVNKIIADGKTHKVELSESKVRLKIDEFEEVARRQILSDKK